LLVTQLSEGPAPTLEMLAAQASQTGFGDVEAVYAAMRERDPKFALPEQRNPPCMRRRRLKDGGLRRSA